MPFVGVSSVEVLSVMKLGLSQQRVGWTLNQLCDRVDAHDRIKYRTMTPDTFVFAQDKVGHHKKMPLKQEARWSSTHSPVVPL